MAKSKNEKKIKELEKQNALLLKQNDNLQNFITGLNTERSKRNHSVWSYGNMNNFAEYEACYQESWLARRICDIIPADMVREWREIKSEKADDVRAEEDRLFLASRFEEALRWSRLYGGAAILMITDQDLTKPLDVNKIKKGSLKRLQVFDRWYMSAGDYQVMDLLSEDFLLPSYYMFSGQTNAEGGAMVHRSHIVRICGESLPLRLQYHAQGWGDSSLRQAMEAVTDFTASIGGIAESMQEFNVDIVTKTGLFDLLASGEEEKILKRFQAGAMGKSVFKTLVLDDDEKYRRKSLSYSGIAQIIETQMKIVAGASHTPVTKLFGDSAKGLNATGEGDDVNYNTYIRSQQASKLDPALRQLDEVLVRSALGYFPEDFNYQWRPLDVPSPLEEAQANQTQANADIAYLNAGVVTVSQLQRELQAREAYQFDDARIEELRKIENEMDLSERFAETLGGEPSGFGEGAEETPPTNSEKRVSASKSKE